MTGVSGSGKSTLVNEVLYKAVANRLHRAKQRPGAHRRISGLDQVDKIINIDQSPIGRTPRSNPATYIGLFDHIRELYSRTQEARARGYKPGRFSFNVKGGRCEVCRGDGQIKIEMHFLPDVYVPCEQCHGKRYNRETLEVRFKGKTIADVLDMTVEEARRVLRAHPEDQAPPAGAARRRARLHPARPAGHDAVRRRGAAREAGAASCRKVATGRTLYILDEPTTGLHFADVQRLLEVLDRLVEQGNTVVVIEHNLDVIKTADRIIDLGPEGGEEGGLRGGAGHARAGGGRQALAHGPLPGQDRGAPGAQAAAAAATEGRGRGLSARAGGRSGAGQLQRLGEGSGGGPRSLGSRKFRPDIGRFVGDPPRLPVGRCRTRARGTAAARGEALTFAPPRSSRRSRARRSLRTVWTTSMRRRARPATSSRVLPVGRCRRSRSSR